MLMANMKEFISNVVGISTLVEKWTYARFQAGVALKSRGTYIVQILSASAVLLTLPFKHYLSDICCSWYIWRKAKLYYQNLQWSISLLKFH